MLCPLQHGHCVIYSTDRVDGERRTCLNFTYQPENRWFQMC
jgi:hypothetical protein